LPEAGSTMVNLLSPWLAMATTSDDAPIGEADTAGPGDADGDAIAATRGGDGLGVRSGAFNWAKVEPAPLLKCKPPVAASTALVPSTRSTKQGNPRRIARIGRFTGC
jgi:hypothetical protein